MKNCDGDGDARCAIVVCMYNSAWVGRSVVAFNTEKQNWLVSGEAGNPRDGR